MNSIGTKTKTAKTRQYEFTSKSTKHNRKAKKTKARKTLTVYGEEEETE